MLRVFFFKFQFDYHRLFPTSRASEKSVSKAKEILTLSKVFSQCENAATPYPGRSMWTESPKENERWTRPSRAESSHYLE